jgi:hypothetical protein
MNLGGGAQLVLQSERPNHSFDCLGFAGIPVVNPIFIVLTCVDTAQARGDLDFLRSELLHQLNMFSPQIRPVEVPCGGGIPNPPGCHAFAEPDCQKLLVVVGDDTQPVAPTSLHSEWIAGGAKFHILPVYRRSARTSIHQLLSAALQHLNVEFWSNSIREAIPAILSLANIAAAQPRI